MAEAIGPDQDKEATLKTYEASAAELSAYFGEIGVRVEDVRTGFALVDKPNPRVVEVGCGNGRDTAAILEYTDDYVGFDLSPAMLELARKSNPDARFEIGDLTSFRFPPRTDLIFSFASILHSDSQEVRTFLANAERALTPRGVIYISTKLPMKGHYERRIKEDEFGRRVFYHYDVPELLHLAPRNLEPAFEDYQRIGRTSWVTLALRKYGQT